MSNSKVFGVTKSKILGGLAAVVVLGIGMDYVIPLLGPLDYLEPVPKERFSA